MTPQEIRDIRGDMSRKEFAAKIGYSHRTVEGWEQGIDSTKPSKRAIDKIKEVMNEYS